MKPLICLYCEGTDTKIAAVTKDKDKVKVIKTLSMDIVPPGTGGFDGSTNLSFDEAGGDGISFDNQRDGKPIITSGITNIGLVNTGLTGINLKKSLFIPIITEPTVYFHTSEAPKENQPNKIAQAIIEDIQKTKNVTIDRNNLGFVELADKSILSVFTSGDIGCIRLINALAVHNGRRYYTIPSVKNAEISLAYFVAKRKKFFPDDNSLVVYIGKEYSKLIFLNGRKIKHIGTTLDIGTSNLHTYDVYFSKILLEMENGGISHLDNIVVCGEDDSENLILSFYGTFPEANVSRLEFDDLDLSALDEESKTKISSFSVTIAVALEYFEELDKEYKGINLLPHYVIEDQKFFQFGWHAYFVLVVLFAVTFVITSLMLKNFKKLGDLDKEIRELKAKKMANELVINDINKYQSRIDNFGQTQAILDTVSKGTEVWSSMLEKTSDLFAARKSVWLTTLTAEENSPDVLFTGFALTNRALPELAYSYEGALLKGVLYEELRSKGAYRFTLTFKLPPKGEVKK
jgi:hypothetical protein